MQLPNNYVLNHEGPQYGDFFQYAAMALNHDMANNRISPLHKKVMTQQLNGWAEALDVEMVWFALVAGVLVPGEGWDLLEALEAVLLEHLALRLN